MGCLMALRRESTALPMLDDGESSNTKLGGLGFMREQLERLRESVIQEVVPVLPD
jgi:hypothetical protein